MDITLTPSAVSGTVGAVSSKSFAHRLLICAALADGPTLVKLNALSDDIRATVRCLTAMGCNITETDGGLRITPMRRAYFEAIGSIKFNESHKSNKSNKSNKAIELIEANGLDELNESIELNGANKSHESIEPTQSIESSVHLDCGESGATARFLLPVAACLYDNFTMTGKGRLPQRPFAPLCDALKANGCEFDNDRLPLTGNGRLRAGKFSIPGDVSSQFISGLLFALPLLDGDSELHVTGTFESAAYVEMTVQALRMFGIAIQESDGCYYISGNQRYRSPNEAQTEGDWSNAAFFLCAGVLDGEITVTGLNPESTQGDREVISILKRFGASIEETTTGYQVKKSRLCGIEIDAAQIPDLVPALSIVAAVAEGTTRIYNAGRLRIKESDRLESTRNMLISLGGDAEITDDGLLIRGKPGFTGGTVDGSGDHRIVMSAAIAACVCKQSVTITGCEAVNKSYPLFFEDYKLIRFLPA
jgi:3-phosphoshikimate 1-carboxyvinyltransferase